MTNTNIGPKKAGPTIVRVSTSVAVAGVEREATYPLTDATGCWLLALTGRFSKSVDQSLVTVRFVFPDETTVDVDQVPVVTGRQTSHTQTALRGRVIDAKGIGKRGVTITSSSDPDLSTATNANGDWSLHFPMDRHTSAPADTTLTALAADGQTQTRDVRIDPRRVVVVEDIHFEEP